MFGSGTGKDSLNIINLSLSDVQQRNLIFLCGDIGTQLRNHQTHAGPSGQFSGTGSIGGGGLQEFCIISN